MCREQPGDRKNAALQGSWPTYHVPLAVAVAIDAGVITTTKVPDFM